MRTLILCLSVASLLLVGCGPDMDRLRVRAASDMDCRPESLRLRELDDRTAVARGCAQQNTYIWACHGDDCTWVLNNAKRVEVSPH